MTRGMTAVSITVSIAAATLICGAPASVAAQDVPLSPVPKDACCFNNFRYSGTCSVQPRQGQLCSNVLNYLNNISSSGEAYCSTTYIRGGWAQVDCESGSASDPVGFAQPKPVEIHDPGTAPATSPSTTPRATSPSELQAVEASVIQVRLEQPLEGGAPTAGQQLVGRVETDVIGPDGEILLPAGSAIAATFGSGSSWSSSPQAGLHLVGTTTSAADLFGTAEGDAPATDVATPSLHLTGEVIEVSEGSVVSFELADISAQPADLRVLTTATDVWMSAFNERDASTIAGLSSDDGALLPPNGRAVIGRDAIFDYWTQRLADTSTRIELVNVESVVEGDLGYKAGRFELVDAKTGSATDRGKYIQIWKKSSQGYWELHRDMWNSSSSSN